MRKKKEWRNKPLSLNEAIGMMLDYYDDCEVLGLDPKMIGDNVLEDDYCIYLLPTDEDGSLLTTFEVDKEQLFSRDWLGELQQEEWIDFDMLDAVRHAIYRAQNTPALPDLTASEMARYEVSYVAHREEER